MEKLKRYYNKPNYPPIIITKEFTDKLLDFNNYITKRISEKVELLIKNPKLRKKMGEKCKKTIFEKFSLKKRNKQLK